MGQLQRVTVTRATLKDLEKGIQELEKRGYELVKRDEEEFENKSFHYRESRQGDFWFDGWNYKKKYKALMERVWEG